MPEIGQATPQIDNVSRLAEIRDPMLGYFISTLAVRALQVQPTVSDDPVRKALFTELQSSLKAFPGPFRVDDPTKIHAAWTEAYRLERLLALVEPPSNLVSELRRQTAEAVDERIPAADRLVAALEAVLPIAVDTGETPPVLHPGGEAVLRALLLQTLEELHWHAQRKFWARPIQKSATYKIVYLVAFAFGLFLWPYAYIYVSILFEHEPQLVTRSGLPLYTALTAGLLGASFSRLMYLQNNWNTFSLGAITDANEYPSLLLRGSVGITGAAIVYFFLQSGAVSGNLFPKFPKSALIRSALPRTLCLP